MKKTPNHELLRQQQYTTPADAPAAAENESNMKHSSCKCQKKCGIKTSERCEISQNGQKGT